MMTREQEAALHVIHGELLALLRDTVRVLEAENLPYSLICGTLLGAVRHGGFIPWDDDIDIVLPRESYERFALIYPEQAGEGFHLDLTDTWVPRVRKAEGRRIAFLDLFVLDPLPEGKFLRAGKLFCLKTLQGMLKEQPEYARFSLSKRVLLRATGFLGKFLSKEAKLRAYRRVARWGDRPGSRWESRLSGYPEGQTETRLGSLPGSRPLQMNTSPVHMANGAFKVLGIPLTGETFLPDNLITVPFEDLPVRVPKNAAEVLTQFYGSDYMTLPPEEQRVPQHLDLS